MPQRDARFWWEKVADISSKEEREMFIKGAMGGYPIRNQGVIQAIIAGYVSGKSVSRQSKNE